MRPIDPPKPRITLELHNFLIRLSKLPIYQGWGDMEGSGSNCEQNEYINTDDIEALTKEFLK